MTVVGILPGIMTRTHPCRISARQGRGTARSGSRSTAAAAMVLAAKLAARPAGTAVSWVGGWGAPMIWGRAMRTTAAASQMSSRLVAIRKIADAGGDDGADPPDLAQHQIARRHARQFRRQARRRAPVAARKPQMPQIKPFCGVIGTPVSSETPASRSGKARAGDHDGERWLKGCAASHRQGPTLLPHVHGRPGRLGGAAGSVAAAAWSWAGAVS